MDIRETITIGVINNAERVDEMAKMALPRVMGMFKKSPGRMGSGKIAKPGSKKYMEQKALLRRLNPSAY